MRLPNWSSIGHCERANCLEWLATHEAGIWRIKQRMSSNNKNYKQAKTTMEMIWNDWDKSHVCSVWVYYLCDVHKLFVGWTQFLILALQFCMTISESYNFWNFHRTSNSGARVFNSALQLKHVLPFQFIPAVFCSHLENVIVTLPRYVQPWTSYGCFLHRCPHITNDHVIRGTNKFGPQLIGWKSMDSPSGNSTTFALGLCLGFGLHVLDPVPSPHKELWFFIPSGEKTWWDTNEYSMVWCFDPLLPFPAFPRNGDQSPRCFFPKVKCVCGS